MDEEELNYLDVDEYVRGREYNQFDTDEDDSLWDEDEYR